MKLTSTERIALLLGFRYKVNLKTKEIHDLRNKTSRCLKMSWKNTDFATQKWVNNAMRKSEYNGCSGCMKKFDTDKK